jgi:hypothetical protein
VFGPILESSRLSLYSLGPRGDEMNDSWVGSQRDCFVMSLLGIDTFSCGVMRWMVYPNPCTGLWLTAAHQRGRAYL